jgi:hypothetical protein
MLRKFEDQVDPERTLTPEERAKRGEAAREAFYTRFSMRPVKAQRERAGGAARA